MGRLVDVDEFLKGMNDSWMYASTARHIISHAPSARVFGQWIETAEREPEESGEYIAWIAGAAKPTTLWFDVNDEGEGVWFEEVEDSTNFFKVSHKRADRIRFASANIGPSVGKKPCNIRIFLRLFALSAPNICTMKTARTPWRKIYSGFGRGKAQTSADFSRLDAAKDTEMFRQGAYVFGSLMATHWMPLPMAPEGVQSAECRVQSEKKPGICNCRACGAEILFITMKSGKKMPCDRKMVRCREDESAKSTFVLPTGAVVHGVEAPDGVADFMGHRSHFETCPYADDFRRK